MVAIISAESDSWFIRCLGAYMFGGISIAGGRCWAPVVVCGDVIAKYVLSFVRHRVNSLTNGS